MLEKLKTLKTILGQTDLVLTGSTALAYHGLLEFTEAKDLDIVLVTPSATATDVLKKLQAENPSPKWKEGSPMAYSFIFEGVKVDIWVVSSHEDRKYLITTDGVQVASIKSIVKSKLSYNRSKDWIQLMQLAKKIYDPTKFAQSLDGIIDHSDDYPEVA